MASTHIHKLKTCAVCKEVEAVVHIEAGHLNHIAIDHCVIGTASGVDHLVVYLACNGRLQLARDPTFNATYVTCLACLALANNYVELTVAWDIQF